MERALTVVIYRKSVQDDEDRAKRDAMAMARGNGFDGEPQSVEEIDFTSEPAWAFLWERTED